MPADACALCPGCVPPRLPPARSAAVKIKSWAVHRVELPELAVPELTMSALRPPGAAGAHTKL